MSIHLVPITISDANVLVKRWHRHHRPTVGGLFAVAVAREGDEEPCGCAIIGRPVARMLDDGWTVEVNRVVTDGTKNACSMLYGAAWRAARALGYRRAITYILNTESGTSLYAAGWKCIGEAGGGSWSVPSRPRVDKHPTQGKLRFERNCATPATKQNRGTTMKKASKKATPAKTPEVPAQETPWRCSCCLQLRPDDEIARCPHCDKMICDDCSPHCLLCCKEEP